MFNKPNDSPERVENFVCLIVFPVPRDMDKWELVISRGVQQPCRDLKILQQLWDEMRIMGGAEGTCLI